ncbi:MAG: Lrp/AsnC family transcriptional regulator, partial [Lacipirellulaceae bacterium]
MASQTASAAQPLAGSQSKKGGDEMIVDCLRRNGQATIAELSEALDVTATAVRQRLARLTEAGIIERNSAPAGRGRPTHQYCLT